ncbi:MAG: hypothetical protein ACNA8K_17165 [Cyclonatronaceae bacterium]
MINKTKGLLLVVAGFFFIATSCDSIVDSGNNSLRAGDNIAIGTSNTSGIDVSDIKVCGIAETVTLWAGQTIDVGTVTISNDENFLYITYETTEDWVITETHYTVVSSLDDLPLNPSERPIVGQFDKNPPHLGRSDVLDPPVSSVTYSFDLRRIEIDPLLVVAHAVVAKIDEHGQITDETETAFGGDIPVNVGQPRGWWYYGSYSIQPCDEDPGDGDDAIWTEETAFGGDLAGQREVNRRGMEVGAWWFIFDANGDAEQGIYAGQKLVDGASVEYDGTYIIINLGPNMRLQEDDEAVKILGYDEAPTSRPAAGASNPYQIYAGSDLTIEVGAYDYYVIHLDVEVKE